MPKGFQGFQKGNELRKGIPAATKGKIGDNRLNWKGEQVSYRTLHRWVTRFKGKPETCEHCGKTGLTGKQINWANKDRQYKRNLEDWIRLCSYCHYLYDLRFEQRDNNGRFIKQ